MTTNLTQFNVLRYVYDETNETMDKKIHESILTDEKIADEFVLITEAKELLDRCQYNASKNTLKNILEYSKSQLSPLVG